MKKTITLGDLAKMANVSMNTVSRALNGRRGIGEATRRKIVALADEYDYHPNINARTMRGLESPLIGIIVGDMEDPFFVQLLSGIEECAWNEGMSIIIGNSSEDPEKQRLCIEHLLSYGCKNLIITPVNDDREPMERLLRKNIRLVLADRLVKDPSIFHRVSINIRMDAKRSVEYLIQCGHRRIAIVNQKSNIDTEIDRTKGYVDALNAYGIPLRDEYTLSCLDPADAGRAVTRLMKLEEPPSALFVAKDRLALHVVSALNEMSISIPNDISVILYGKPDWSQTFHPFFTCMDRPVKEIGRTAARVVISKIKEKNDDSVVNIVYDSHLVIKDSVKIL